MARIEDIGSVFYGIKSRNEHNPPHFHFFKKQGKKDVSGRIYFEKAEYYDSKTQTAKLTNDEKEALYKTLQLKVDGDRFGRTYWERAIDDWNALPGVTKLSIDLPIPDYRKL
jgi:protocatechuate 3,4-dioxygenase beta subunit